ncbi:hypothetical protein AAL_01039 [Moelleriella libera RCEF 2490]|uniref:AA1-like domain-containing protein n=1 Tax=Moelleriella libera RCEF 2490 TaxID=1081109 RepID=A0A166VEK5_9HYPO|nr:hypothetical protein AAL_01039 [Moelleriella libera RCEF 2490]
MHFVASIALLAGAALAAPAATLDTRQDAPCTRTSSLVRQWSVKDFDYHASYVFTTPAHQNSWGYVNFTLVNAVLNLKTQCSAASNQLQDFYYGNFIYNCTQFPEEVSTATFTFSRPQNELKVNQTWICPEEESQFWGEGGAKLKLDCKDETWKNPNWTVGQIYTSRTVTCNHIDAPIPIDSMRAIA